jgi:hypothetical protein
MQQRIEEKRAEAAAVVKIQGGRRGKLGRRKVSAIRCEIEAVRQHDIGVIEDEINSALSTSRDDRETKLARELASYRAARDAQIQARRKRTEEETVAPRPQLTVRINYESAAACTIQVRHLRVLCCDVMSFALPLVSATFCLRIWKK